MTTLRNYFAALLLLALMCFPVNAAEIRIAVASNFSAPLAQISALFQQQTGNQLKISIGSTGKLYAQIQQGAPFDLLIAADTTTPQKLEAEGLTVRGSSFVYALGKLVLWSAQAHLSKTPEELLRQGAYHKLAIADPKLAPYGRAAQETLTQMGLWNAVQSKLVQGENITQAYQFVATENAELGFIALSQITQNGKAGSGWIVPAQFYTPLRQSAVMLQTAQDKVAAQAFLSFLQSKQVLEIIRNFGYTLP